MHDDDEERPLSPKPIKFSQLRCERRIQRIDGAGVFKENDRPVPGLP